MVGISIWSYDCFNIVIVVTFHSDIYFSHINIFCSLLNNVSCLRKQTFISPGGLILRKIAIKVQISQKSQFTSSRWFSFFFSNLNFSTNFQIHEYAGRVTGAWHPVVDVFTRAKEGNESPRRTTPSKDSFKHGVIGCRKRHRSDERSHDGVEDFDDASRKHLGQGQQGGAEKVESEDDDDSKAVQISEEGWVCHPPRKISPGNLRGDLEREEKIITRQTVAYDADDADDDDDHNHR